MKTTIQIKVLNIASISSSRLVTYLLIVLLICSGTIYSFDKSGTTSFQFLSVRPSSRAASLAGAFCTLADNSEASFWNPACLTKVQNIDVSMSFIDYFLDVKMFAFSAAYTTQDWGTIGLFGLYTDVGSIEETTRDFISVTGDVVNPGLTGRTFTPYQFYGGISYAKSLTSNFAFGINMKYVEENLVYAKAGEIVFDGGINFNTDYKSIQIGASIKNFGKDIKYIDKAYPIPQTLNIGASANLIGNSGNNLFIDSDIHKLLLAYDIIQPRDYAQEHAVGMEYSYNKMVSLRVGYKFNGDQEGLSAGLGIHYQALRVDYSYSAFGDYLPAVHRVTLGFEFR
jgi:hypothetical protein